MSYEQERSTANYNVKPHPPKMATLYSAADEFGPLVKQAEELGRQLANVVEMLLGARPMDASPNKLTPVSEDGCLALRMERQRAELQNALNFIRNELEHLTARVQ